MHHGKLMQFLPQDNVYAFFRYDVGKTVLVLTNLGDKAIKVDTKRFAERMAGMKSARNVLTDQSISNLNLIEAPAKTALVLELAK